MNTNKIHCCIDLELEQPYTNHQTPDSKLDKEMIIQVGYVIYEIEPDFKVLEDTITTVIKFPCLTNDKYLV